MDTTTDHFTPLALHVQGKYLPYVNCTFTMVKAKVKVDAASISYCIGLVARFFRKGDERVPCLFYVNINKLITLGLAFTWHQFWQLT